MSSVPCIFGVTFFGTIAHCSEPGAASAPPTIAPAKIGQLIKGGSSAWIHEEFPELRDFDWQDGYAAFTVSKSGIPDLTAYIENQREHHRTRTFKDEFLALPARHGIEYDLWYVWD